MRGGESGPATDGERDEIHRVIMDELVRGRFEPSGIAFHQAVIDRMRSEEGCDAVILGCTEIGMLLGAADVAVPLFDTTALHAAAAVTSALA